MKILARPAFIVAAIALSRFSTLMIQVAIARIFAPELFGKFAFILGVFSLFMPALTLSIADVATYLSMRCGGKESYLRLLLSYLPWNALLFGIGALGVGYFTQEFFIAGVVSVFLFSQFQFYSIIQSQRLFASNGDFALLVFVYNIVLAILLLVMLNCEVEIMALSLASVLASALCLALFRSSRHDFHWMFSQKIALPSPKEGKQIFSFCATNLVSQASLNIEIIILGLVLTAADVAQYRTASIILFGVMAIPTILYAYMAPTIAANSTTQRPWATYVAFLKKAALPSIALLCVVKYGAQVLFVPVFGAAYADGLSYLQLMLPMMAIGLLVRIPVGNVLAYTGSSRLNALNGIVGLFVSVCATYFAARSYGVAGAIFGATLSWTVTGVLGICFIRRARTNVD